MSVGNTSANALLQAAAPPDLRGEAISMYMLAMRGGLSLGSLLTGVSVSLIGIREALLINGSLALLACFIVGRQWLRLPGPNPANVC